MSSALIIKISLLASSQLLLNGRPVSLADLRQMLDRQAGKDAVVWYYRENADTLATPIAQELMAIVVKKRLPIRLSTRPDFSDSAIGIASDQVMQPRDLSVEQRFQSIRETAARHQLAIVRPDGQTLYMPATKTAPPELIKSIERLLPSTPRRHVAVIADTQWSALPSTSLQDANRAIPFFGMLMGFNFLGHVVWVFDGSADSLSSGCTGADVLILDSDRLASMPVGWENVARKAMIHPDILVHDRSTYKLRRLN
jgi:hypothetical protein